MQKQILTILISTISVLSFINGSAQLNKKCPNKNPFLKIVVRGRTGNVKLLEEPTFSTNITMCKKEWTKYGNCCSEETIIKHINQDSRNIKNAMLSTQQSTINYLKNLHALVAESELIIKNANKTSNIELLKAARSLVDSISNLDQHLGSTINSTDWDSFHLPINKCWDKMIAMRKGSLCSTCSSRGDIFFYKGKALISEETCEEVLSICTGYFNKMIGIVNTIEIVEQSFQAYTTETSILHGMNPKSIFSMIDKLINSIDGTLIYERIESYGAMLKLGQTTKKLDFQLCSEMISLQSEPFITTNKEIIFYGNQLLRVIRRMISAEIISIRLKKPETNHRSNTWSQESRGRILGLAGWTAMKRIESIKVYRSDVTVYRLGYAMAFYKAIYFSSDP